MNEIQLEYPFHCAVLEYFIHIISFDQHQTSDVNNQEEHWCYDRPSKRCFFTFKVHKCPHDVVGFPYSHQDENPV